MVGKRLTEEEKAAERKRQRKRLAIASSVARGIIAILVVAVILLNVFTHVLQVVTYKGDGMEPSLSSGETLVLLRTQNVDPGDIIAFYYNNQILVRRVICEGGEQVSIEPEGTVCVDGQALKEPYLKEASVGQCNLTFPYYVQTGHVFVMGDNRVIAMDSRLKEIGPIPEERIVGRVLFSI